MNINMKSPSSPQKKRNVSVDLIRIIAMMMVVVLHVANMSGFVGMSYEQDAVAKWISNCWEAPTIIAVNLFALLTGYLCVEAKWRISRYLVLWMQMVFYVILINGTMWLLGEPVSLRGFLFGLWPLSNVYWYFISYSALFAFMPFINRGIKAINKSEIRLLCVLSILIYSIFGFYSSRPLAGDGHCVLWLGVMYLCGAYIKLYGVYPPPCDSRYLVCSFASWCLKHLRWVSLCVFVICCIMDFLVLKRGRSAEGLLFRHYNSPILCIEALAFFVMLINIPVQSVFCSRILQFLSPMAFGVYLFHCGVWGCLATFLSPMAVNTGYPWWFIPAFSVAIYAVGTLVDYVRIKLFTLFRMQQLCQYAVSKMPACIRQMEEW